MIENNIEDEDKLQRVITEKTRPETVNNLGKYISIPKTETVKIEDKIIKEIKYNDNNKKACLNSNIKRNSKQNIDLYFLSKRVDRFNNPIAKGGKQKITFIDRVTKNGLVEVIKVESFKEYNKMEEVSNNKRNNCCLLL